ncbi:MAG TPA: class I SAM-dependent methyltransferase [Rectinemataceae bacterium]|nr:class I SAM-dependent methyltransferase [Rectinemataceae bacterium]
MESSETGLLPGYRAVCKKGISRVELDGRRLSVRPWMGGGLAPFYDAIMENSLFPGTFGASYQVHMATLAAMIGSIHEKRVLELGTGSGSSALVLPPDNRYVGVDTSEALLRRAVGKFKRAAHTTCLLFLCSAEDLPFESGSFDAAICNLSLNFFGSIETAVDETARVLVSGAKLVASVPVPERNGRHATIRGRLLSEHELRSLFELRGFAFKPEPVRNGALLYFSATRTG